MTNEETDTALILENELRRRVKEIARDLIYEEVKNQVASRFADQKTEMLLEVSLKIGQMLRVIEAEGRQPLWVTGPEAMQSFGGNDAVRKQTPSV